MVSFHSSFCDEETNFFFFLEIYEKRSGAKDVKFPDFFCFYTRAAGTNDDSDERPEVLPDEIDHVATDFHDSDLPKIVYSGKDEYVLKRGKRLFWRTFNQSEMNGENFYYQQIVLKYPIFNTTFEKLKEPFGTWRGK